MNILFLTHRIPYPPDKGDKIRSYNEIKYLSKKHDIYLGTILDYKSEKENINELEKYCREIFSIYFNKKLNLLKCMITPKPFSVINFYHKSLQDYVDKTLQEKKIDAVIVFCSSMAEYIFKTPLFRKNRLGGIKLIMDYIDLDSDKWLQYSKYAKFPFNWIFKIENKRLFKYEIKINRSFQHSIFVSNREINIFKTLYREAINTQVISNGVDYDYFSPKSTLYTDLEINKPDKLNEPNKPVLLFTGVMDYFANEDGVKWFCHKIFPKIRSVFPSAEFYIVGNRPSNIVWNLSKIDGVTVTGYVADIRDYYWKATVCVIPLRIARGLQNKVLEAMATGNTVVATTNASAGIVCNKNVDIAIADDEQKFADEVIDLLKDAYRRKKMGEHAVKNIRKNYSWETNLKAFDDILQS